MREFRAQRYTEMKKSYTEFFSIMLCVFVFFVGNKSFAQSLDLNGMAIGWGTASYSEQLNGQLGIRYIPKLSAEVSVREKYSFDAEVSVNGWAASTFWSNDSIQLDEDLKPYRMWLRFSGDQFEVRAGLQKINFGSSSFFRPLMWFDQIDPRDPLQLTDGVYGILGRYYFLNNANIWIWGLIGNDDPKGWEIFESEKDRPEFGGRIQIPVWTGEMGLTYHNRSADIRMDSVNFPANFYGFVPENRFGIDAKFDYEIGFWFESSVNYIDFMIKEYTYTKLFNIGLDYTIGFGNGLNVMTEFFVFDNSEKFFKSGNTISFSALALNYPVSIINNINAMIFMDPENKELYNFINWSWQFDRWSIYLMGFWNPDRFQIYPGRDEINLYAGKGIQIMAVFNH